MKSLRIEPNSRVIETDNFSRLVKANRNPIPKVFQTAGNAKKDAASATTMAMGMIIHSGMMFLDSKNSNEPRLPPEPAGETRGRNS